MAGREPREPTVEEFVRDLADHNSEQEVALVGEIMLRARRPLRLRRWPGDSAPSPPRSLRRPLGLSTTGRESLPNRGPWTRSRSRNCRHHRLPGTVRGRRMRAHGPL